jgi:uncharacterized protein
MLPQFPAFKQIELSDRNLIHTKFWDYQPETSELTFSNLFTWRNHYGFQWSMLGDWLIVLGEKNGNQVWALPPTGPGPRVEAVRELFRWMKNEKGVAVPRIERADGRLVKELEGALGLSIEPTREHFDYVYKTRDLIELAGKNYRQKRNHINYLLRSYSIDYEPLSESNVQACLELSETWCQAKRCGEDLNLAGEWEAIQEGLNNFAGLEINGGAITINGRVAAFTLGESLNHNTAVVHFEKANVEIRGLYAVINQQFCERALKEIAFTNREQDLGELGLRKAKLSYNPERLVEKYRINYWGYRCPHGQSHDPLRGCPGPP